MCGNAMVIESKNSDFSFSNKAAAIVLLWLAFLVDAFIWPSALGAVDFRAVYVVVALAIMLGVVSQRILVSKEFLWVFAGMFLWSVPSVLLKHDIFVVVMGQIVGAAVLSWFAYYLLRSIGSMEKTAIEYFKISQIIAIFVIFEQVLFLIGGVDLVRGVFGVIPARTFGGYFEHGLYRASGLLYEPSQVGLILAPAICMSLYLHRLRTVILCVAAIFASFSSLGMIGVALAFVLSRRNWFVRISYIIPALAVILVLSANIEPFQSRVWNLIEIGDVLLGENDVGADVLRDKGGTVATLVANAKISLSGAAESPVFGWGLGTFRYYYVDRLEKVLPGAYGSMGFYNPGGSSLMLRLLLEIGFVGMLIVIYAYVKRVSVAVKSKVLLDKWCYAWVLGSTCFILLSLLRKDLVVSFYLWFFVCAFIIATRRHSVLHGNAAYRCR